jgi:hypothetical protein
MQYLMARVISVFFLYPYYRYNVFLWNIPVTSFLKGWCFYNTILIVTTPFSQNNYLKLYFLPKAGFPPGVLNVIPGYDSNTGSKVIGFDTTRINVTIALNVVCSHEYNKYFDPIYTVYISSERTLQNQKNSFNI